MPSSPNLRDPYDELPYVSLPITYSQPALLAAQAHLRGLSPPAADTARVLEIGAASGGNIIPLAARFPNAHFLGVDLAAGHVEIGQRRIAELGLTNITLAQGDITDADFGDQQFDYIICHGVFSWAPPEARDAILRVCADTLSDTGVAAISYNVFPGWHTRNVIRDICLQHKREGETPRQQVEAVRELLQAIATASSDKSPYGFIVRSEAARLKTRPASYILGELLAAYNQPFHVRDVVAHASGHGLAYLSESDLMASTPEYCATKAAAQIRAMAGSDPLAVEQYTDMFSGRTFRRSLFIRSGLAPSAPTPSRLAQLHITASSLERADGQESNALMAAVDTRLAQIYPFSCAVADLIVEGGRAGNLDAASAARQVLPLLANLIARGKATVSTQPSVSGAQDTDRPSLWSVSRNDAASGQPWVTNLQHLPVLLTPVLKALAPLMDGANTRTGLSRALAAAIQSGALPAADLPDVGEADMAARAVAIVDRVIEHCARNALLDA